jgi:hypothetical protein
LRKLPPPDSSPFTTWFGVRNSAWRWTGAAPEIYRSSPGVRRFFCATCGTPMAYASTRYPEETHFYAASLDDPTDFAPTVHYHEDEQLRWIHLADDLPRRGLTERHGTD